MTETVDFDSWYRREHKKVLAVVTMLCAPDHARAEDATNDAFVKALERWPSVGKMDAPGAWVTRVALNKAKRSLRLRGRRIRLLHTEDVVEDKHIDGELWRAVSELPERQRHALLLRYIDDYSQKQIAAELEIAPGTAAATLSQARKNLRAEIEIGGSE